MIPFNPERIWAVLPDILSKFPKTLEIVLVTAILGALLGLGLANWHLKAGTIRQKIASHYISAMRCTPPIVLIFLVFYALPKLIEAVFLIDINGWPKGLFVIGALTLLFSANIAVTFEAAYLAIPKGQTEAGLVSGLSETRTFVRIILPQALVVALPNIANNLLTLLKEGTLAYMIGYVDIMGEAQNIISRNLGNYGLETYVAVTLVYWAVAIVIEGGSLQLEKGLSRYKGQGVEVKS
ncbi:MAG: ABC transporter permease subunit [Streptococcaceae bacterium]|jgi:L-cystine transport system permease protein|nr:ABC transporter permease subunit [Streptococcaceae bacterium]